MKTPPEKCLHLRRRLATALGIFAIAACSRSDEAPGPADTTLLLTSQDSQLVLAGSPVDPNYEGVYPNPDGIREMVVIVQQDGRLDVSCDAGSEECRGAPFFTNSRAVEDGTIVSVWDLFGTPIAEYVFSETDDVTSPNDATDEPECDEVDDVRGCPNNEPDEPDEPTPYCPEDDVTDCQPPGYPTGECEDEIQEICERTNANLQAQGLDYQVDCSKVDGTFSPDDLVNSYGNPVDRTTERPAVWRCNDIIDPPPPTGECVLEELNAVQKIRFNLIHEGICLASPLVLDLDGDGVNLSSLQDGVSFDLLASGTASQISWTDGQDGFLVLDTNGSGAVEDASELFGNHTGYADFSDGFAALRKYDDDGNGQINGKDAVFSSLLVWQDKNRDGVSQPYELSPLASFGITSLKVNAKTKTNNIMDSHGNAIPLVSSFTTSDGRRGQLVDAFLQVGTPQVCEGTQKRAPSPTPLLLQ